jgi:phytol kinase
VLDVTQGDLLGLAGVYGYVGAVVAVSWLLKGRVRDLRKLVHILTGGIVFFWWSFDTRLVMAGLAAFPFVILLLLATPHSPIAFLRKSPLGERSEEGHAYGLVMYAFSWTVIAYFMFDELYAASIAIAAMSLGDGMAGLVGKRYGRHEYSSGKTIEGSLAILVTTVACIVVITWFYFDVIGYSSTSRPEMTVLFALAIGIFATLIEAASPGEIDNLVVPLVLAGFLHVMGV